MTAELALTRSVESIGEVSLSLVSTPDSVRIRRRRELLTILFELVGQFSQMGLGGLDGPVGAAASAFIGAALAGLTMQKGFREFMGADYRHIQGPTRLERSRGVKGMPKIDQLMLILRRFATAYMCRAETSDEIQQFDATLSYLNAAVDVYLCPEE